MDARTTWGAWTIATAGAVWAGGSAAYGDWIEAARCASVGVGFAMVALSMGEGAVRRPLLLAAGFGIGALGSLQWIATARSPTNGWLVLGVGLIVATLVAALFALGRRTPTLALRGALALVGLGAVLLLRRATSLDVWTASYAATLVGAAPLVWAPPRLHEKSEATAPP